jgi:hypothetical protein
MYLNEIIWHWNLTSVDDKRIMPFIMKTLPYLVLIARGEAALYYDCEDQQDTLSQALIKKYIIKCRNYDTIEVSRIVENWRKEYGTNESASNGSK